MPPAVLIDYGCHSFTYRLAAHLDDLGVPIRYFANGSLESPNQSSLAEWTRSRPGLIRSLSCRKPYGKLSLHRRLLGELEWAKECTAALEAENPSVILLSCVPLAAVTRIQRWARQRSTPVIYWLQDLQGHAIHDLLGRKLGLAGKVLGALAYFWEQEVMDRSRMVITIASDHERELPSSVRFEHRHELLENWADIENFPQYSPDNEWAHRHGLGHTKNLLYSGTLGLKHDLGLFLALAEHFRNRSDVRVVVVSSGQAAEALRTKAHAQHLTNLLVFPFQPYEDVPKVLATAAVLIAPLDSSAGTFCVPSKVLSYFCAGRPTVIAINETNPVAALMRRISAGAVVRPGDAVGFIEAVSGLLADEGARQTAGAAGRQYAEASFALKNVAQKFLTILARSGISLPPHISDEFHNVHSFRKSA